MIVRLFMRMIVPLALSWLPATSRLTKRYQNSSKQKTDRIQFFHELGIKLSATSVP